MSKKDPYRQTRNWRIKSSRRPDAIIVKDASKPWSGDNIAALIECKWGDDRYQKGQEKAYRAIAGGSDKVIEMNDTNCQCPEDEKPNPEPILVPARRPVSSTEQARSFLPNGAQPVAVGLATLGVIALAVAAVASAPVLATAAAAMTIVGLLGSRGSPASGGNDVI
jgi:hypothetical protein